MTLKSVSGETMKFNPLRYSHTQVVLGEVPDEVSLAFVMTGCPHRCSKCHSMELWEEKGKELDLSHLIAELDNSEGITCVVFMGGEWYPWQLYLALGYCQHKGFKTALYTGKELEEFKWEITASLLDVLDYLKVGPYKEELGGLQCKTTNQRMYKVEQDGNLTDITYKFWREEGSV